MESVSVSLPMHLPHFSAIAHALLHFVMLLVVHSTPCVVNKDVFGSWLD